jgi:hypothetical protein
MEKCGPCDQASQISVLDETFVSVKTTLVSLIMNSPAIRPGLRAAAFLFEIAAVVVACPRRV